MVTVEDFTRMQEQLNVLKTEKYETDEKAKRLESELNEMKKIFDATDKQLQKANKVIAKSKKHKEMQGLIDQHENELEELRIQNQGLLQNLNEISALNEKLQKPQAGRTSSSELSEMESRCQDLQKELEEEQSRHEQHVKQLKESLAKETDERKAAQAKVLQLLEQPSPHLSATASPALGRKVVVSTAQPPAAAAESAALESAPADVANGHSPGDSATDNAAPGSAAAAASTVQDQLREILRREYDLLCGTGSSESKEGDANGAEVAGAVEAKEDFVQRVLNSLPVTAVGSGPVVSTVVASLPVENMQRVEALQEANKEIKLLLEKEEERASAASKALEETEEKQRTTQQQLTAAQKQLQQMQQTLKETEHTLRAEVLSLEEKVKRKQANFLALQEEKEKLFTESQQTLTNLKEEKERDVTAAQKAAEDAHAALQKQLARNLDGALEERTKELQEVTARLQSTIAANKELAQQLEQLQQNTARGAEEAQHVNTELETQCQTLAKQLQDAVEAHQAKIKAMEDKHATEVKALKQSLNSLEQRCRAAEEEGAQSRLAKSEAEQKLSSALEARENTAKELEEAKQLAQRRRETVDELAKEKQVLVTEYDQRLKDAEEKHAAALAESKENSSKQISSLQSRMKALIAKCEQLEATASELPPLKEQLSKSEEECKNAITSRDQMKGQLEAEIEHLKLQLEEVEKAKTDKEEEAKAQISALTEQVEQEKQAAKDSLKELEEKYAEAQLAERKAQVLIKDLRKQLKVDQKRINRVEMELEVSRGKESVHGSSDDVRKTHRRNPSVQSGSSMSPSDSVSVTSAPIVNQHEHAELLHRVTRMQTEVAEWKERAHVLDSQKSELENRLRQKSELVKHLTSSGSATASPVGSAKPKKGAPKQDPGLQEMNAKMQTILEETLMKNIQLQKLVEALSAEKAEQSNSETTRSSE
eukprot:m.87757 g.87757  ORF g.87757 m.87757 type:complete len:940 (+) comp18033_c0_seq1:75-2894(+)